MGNFKDLENMNSNNQTLNKTGYNIMKANLKKVKLVGMEN